MALTQAIADETKGTNITANIVLLSVIDTPANRQAVGEENAEQVGKTRIPGTSNLFSGIRSS